MDPMQMLAMQTQILQGIAQVVGNMQQAHQQPPPAPVHDAISVAIMGLAHLF